VQGLAPSTYTSSTGGELEVPQEELFDLCAVDPVLYCRQFFPKVFRQPSPGFHVDYWDKIENPEFDFFGAEVFRGGAKTTLARACISRRIAYGISHNILSVAISEQMSVNTVRWIKKQVDFNTAWTQTFGLTPGAKWADDWIEIYHKIFGYTINVIAKGMTSGLRGLNLDEWRPDFIYCDDICNDENTATPEQREKTSNLLFGALVPSLAAKSEAPRRKLVLTQTSLHKEDCIALAHKDPSWQTVKYPLLFTDERGEQRSAWEEMYPVKGVLESKQNYIKRRQIHIWLREFEAKLISSETAAFDGAWLRYWTALPVGMRVFIGLDPASSKKKQAHKTAIVAVGELKGQVYLLEYYSQQGKNPEEIWTYLIGAVRRLHPMKVGVETVAYQKMLAWYLRQKMLETGQFFVIQEINDRRSKPDRIRQAYGGIASNGVFWINENHTEFVDEFTNYADDVDSDLLDAGAMAICLANPWMLVAGEEDQEYLDAIVEEESNIPLLTWQGGAP
jgi:hypothetical protein